MDRSLIYDVGMNNGDDTAYYLHRGFKVLAIDAHPMLASEAAIRFKDELTRGQLQILNVGLASTPGTLDFWVCETHSEWSSFDKTIAAREGCPHHSVQVPCQTFRWVLKNYGVPYYLKVDIEGNDFLCIESLAADDLPKYVSVETDGTISALERFKALGYNGYKCISQFAFLPLQLPPVKETCLYMRWIWLLKGNSLPARVIRRSIGRERLITMTCSTLRQAGWKFSEGSSGPFGEDTAGRWLGFDEMVATYRHFLGLFEGRKKSPFWIVGKDYSFWSDFHVRRDD